MSEKVENWRGKLNEYIQQEKLKGDLKVQHDNLSNDQYSKFVCRLTFNNFNCSGEGRTKKLAIQKASKIMLTLLDKHESYDSCEDNSFNSTENFYANHTKKILNEFEKMEMVEKMEMGGVTYYKVVE